MAPQDQSTAEAQATAALWALAAALPSIRAAVPITLDLSTTNYLQWRSMFSDAVQKYALEDHLLEDEYPAKPTPQWNRNDAIVRSWLNGAVAPELLAMVVDTTTPLPAHSLWTRLSNIYHDNAETRSSYLEQEFHGLQQDSMTVTDYCRKQKVLADELNALGTPISDKRLVQNTLRGLQPKLAYMRTLTLKQRPLPSFLDVRSSLLLEELTLQQSGSLSSAPTPTAFIARGDSTPQPPRAPPDNTTQPRRPDACRNFQRGSCRFGARCRYLHSAPPQQRGNAAGKGPQVPWPSMQNPWAGSIQMWPGPPQRPPLLAFPQAHNTMVSSPSLWPYGAAPPMPWPPGAPAPPLSWTPGAPPSAPPPAPTYNAPPPSFDQGHLMQAFNTMSLTPPSSNEWVMDSGASAHMTSNPGNLSHILPSNSSYPHVIIGNGHALPITRVGHTTLSTPNHTFYLNNVLVTPDLIKNLISTRKFTTDNFVSVEFDPFGLSVKDFRTKNVIVRCNSLGDLYPFWWPPPSPAHALSTTTSSSTLWHRRLGHLSSQALSHLASAFSFPCNKNAADDHLCHACQLGKHVRLPFDTSSTQTSRPFQLIHCDLWTSPLPSVSGYKYYLVVLDDFTHYLWTFPLRQKSDTFPTLKHFFAYVSTQFNTTIQSIQCDNGREFDNSAAHLFLLSLGATLRMSCPYTSPQNGKAERVIRSTNNMVRSLLFQASMPAIYWVEALHTATFLFNLHPTKTLKNRTPYEALRGLPLPLDHLRVLGCLCYPNLSATVPHKLAPRTTACVFLGYPSNHRGYRCLDLASHKIIISRHVVFDENTFPFAQQSTPPTATDLSFLDDFPVIIPTVPAQHTPLEPPTPPTPEPTTPPTPEPPSPPVVLAPVGPALTTNDHSMFTRGKRGMSKPVDRLTLHADVLSPLPKSYRSALKDPHWHSAMMDEFSALQTNRTWDLVPRPPGANVVSGKWIFRHKLKPDGSLERYKARWVLRGFTQRAGVDYGETFSPVVKPATVRTVLSIAVAQDWPVHQLDINNAFLHGTLAETVYCAQPSGFVDATKPDHVCRLNKSLYGLKQAPRAWYSRFADHLLRLGFVGSRADSSLFIYTRGTDIVYLLLYVDDIVLTASSELLLRQTITALEREFSLKDLGSLHYFLGVAVTRSSAGMFLSQRQYILDVLERAGMTECNPCSTPVDTQSKLGASGAVVADPSHYRSIVGALQYLSFTRPDVAYAVQQVCLYMHDPREPHLNAAKRILRYLRGTVDHGLQIHRSSLASLTAYTDADWADCPDTRKSTSGYGVFLGDNLISWSSKRQQTVSRSSAEAEYRGVANAVAEACWLRQLMAELHRPLLRATVVYCDNISAIYLSTNPVQHQRTKHVEIDLHFVRERVAFGDVRVLHVPTSSQYADIFTKGLPSNIFTEFRSSLNVRLAPALTAGGC